MNFKFPTDYFCNTSVSKRNMTRNLTTDVLINKHSHKFHSAWRIYRSAATGPCHSCSADTELATGASAYHVQAVHIGL